MNNRDLNIALMTEARRLGLCDQWHNRWLATGEYTPQQLIDMYYQGLDFAIEHHYPSNDFIRRAFDKKLLRSNGVLVDDTFSLLNPRHAILLGDSESTIRFNGYHVGEVYVRDNSSATVIAHGHARVQVHVLDAATVKILENDGTRVAVFRQGENAYMERL